MAGRFQDDLTAYISADTSDFESGMKKIEIKARDTGKILDKNKLFKLEVDFADLQIEKEQASRSLRELKAQYAAGIVDKSAMLSAQKEFNKLADATTEAGRTLKNYKNTGDETVSRLQAKFNNLSTSIGGTFTRISGGISAVLGAIGAKSLVKSVFGSSAELEQTRVAFNSLIGDTEIAGNVLNDLADFSAKTPFEFPGVADAGRKLMAVAGIVKEDLIPTLNSLGDIAASQGKSLDQITEAYNDAITGEFERLKEFGIRASVAGDKVTFTFKGQKKEVDKTSESIGKYLVELGKAEGVSGAMEQQSKTLNGVISTMKDNFGFVTKAIFGVSKSGEILEGGLASKLRDIINLLGEVVGKFVIWTQENPKIASAIGIVVAVLGGLAVALGLVGAALTLVIPGLTALFVVLSPFIYIISAITLGLTAFGVAYATNFLGFRDVVKNVIEFVIEKIKGLIEIFGLFIQFLKEKFGDEISQIIDAVKSVFGLFVLFVTDIFSKLKTLFNAGSEDLNIWGKTFGIVGELIKLSLKITLDIIEAMLGVIAGIIKTFVSLVTLDFSGMKDGIVLIMSSLGEGMNDVFLSIKDSILGVLKQISEEAYQWGANIVNSLANGIKANVKKVTDAVKSVGDKIVSYIGVKSPTKEGPLAIDQSIWGKNLVTAVAKGMDSGISDIKSQSLKVAEAMKSPIGISSDSIIEKISTPQVNNTTTTNAPIINVQATINNDVDISKVGKALAREITLASKGIY